MHGGRYQLIITNHKPLDAICVMFRHQKYDINVRHKPGKNIPVVDSLSRLYLKDTDDTHEAFDAQVHAVITSLPVSKNKIAELQICTKEVPDLQQLIGIILIGWQSYHNGIIELSYRGGSRGRVQGVHTSPPPPRGFLIQLVF